MITLSNSTLTISIKRHGAELCSILRNGTEHLWQADPAIWARHSPVLFPIVGRVWENRYRVLNREYSLPQHGFARDMDFTLVSQTESEAWWLLESNEETLAKYPYPFSLRIGYVLDGDKVIVKWDVENTGSSLMHFQIGAHPAFVLPEFDANNKGANGYFDFDNQGELYYCRPGEKGCAETGAHLFEPDCGTTLAITPNAFGPDTYMFENGQLHRVSILDKQHKPYISVDFDAPLVALWAPVKAHPECPFVCIEPWYGRCDYMHYEGDFASRAWINHLEPGKHFAAEYTITVHR